MDSPPDCAVTGETAVTEPEDVRGRCLSDTGRGDPGLWPLEVSSPHGKWKNRDLSVVHFTETLW